MLYLFHHQEGDPKAALLVLSIKLFFQENLHQLTSGLGYARSRPEDAYNTCAVEEVVILCRYYTSCKNHDVATSQFLKFLNKLWNKGLVSGGK